MENVAKKGGVGQTKKRSLCYRPGKAWIEGVVVATVKHF